MPLKISHLYYTSITRPLDLYERALRARSRCRVNELQKSTKNKAVFRADPLAKLPPFLIFLSVFLFFRLFLSFARIFSSTFFKKFLANFFFRCRKKHQKMCSKMSSPSPSSAPHAVLRSLALPFWAFGIAKTPKPKQAGCYSGFPSVYQLLPQFRQPQRLQQPVLPIFCAAVSSQRFAGGKSGRLKNSSHTLSANSSQGGILQKP